MVPSGVRGDREQAERREPGHQVVGAGERALDRPERVEQPLLALDAHERDAQAAR